jgi:hypothetical protein
MAGVEIMGFEELRRNVAAFKKAIVDEALKAAVDAVEESPVGRLGRGESDADGVITLTAPTRLLEIKKMPRKKRWKS